MSTLQTLKTFISQRLAVAVEEISGLLETTISNYEEEISRQRRLLSNERSGSQIHTAVKKINKTWRLANLWPAVFPIPVFSYNTELALQQGNDIFLKDGTLLTSQSVKSDILERLAEAMFSYTAYPNDPQRTAVAHALIERHPCLREPGSYNGCDGGSKA
ncbi:hypothetical protein F7725_012095 [Dissostichus mawsoni]|uniref:Uncharacterized protein n=1 Tax=Dissostichus mawsoni TaxID=36200 RepID=A0A7J5ZAR6_DISMA|nr:hypothetical protein F7725_012095 [Dissostichus mawsoni]